MSLNGRQHQGGWLCTQERTIPSETAAGKQIIEELLSDLARLEWGEQEIFGIHLAVEEAVVNAIKHGNQFAADKSVRVCYYLNPDQLRVEITDEGGGFNPDAVPDPTEDENLECPSGRGLMLMRSFMSVVRFNDVGNSVLMERSRAAASSAP
jgi:serine/threonine-protein kinase RsbW